MCSCNQQKTQFLLPFVIFSGIATSIPRTVIYVFVRKQEDVDFVWSVCKEERVEDIIHIKKATFFFEDQIQVDAYVSTASESTNYPRSTCGYVHQKKHCLTSLYGAKMEKKSIMVDENDYEATISFTSGFSTNHQGSPEIYGDYAVFTTKKTIESSFRKRATIETQYPGDADFERWTARNLQCHFGKSGIFWNIKPFEAKRLSNVTEMNDSSLLYGNFNTAQATYMDFYVVVRDKDHKTINMPGDSGSALCITTPTPTVIGVYNSMSPPAVLPDGTTPNPQFHDASAVYYLFTPSYKIPNNIFNKGEGTVSSYYDEGFFFSKYYQKFLSAFELFL